MAFEANFRLRLLNTPETELIFETDSGNVVYLNNLNQVIWPESSSTDDPPLSKRQLIAYYLDTLPLMLPYIKGQMTIPRLYPNGIEEDCFYPLFHPQRMPAYIQPSVDLQTEKTGVILANEETILYFLNMGAIAFECPLRKCLTIQLYGTRNDIPFKTITTLAACVKERLDQENKTSYVKPFQFTRYADSKQPSGKKTDWHGLDIIIPTHEPHAKQIELCQQIAIELSNVCQDLKLRNPIHLHYHYQEKPVYTQALGKLSSSHAQPPTNITPDCFSPYSFMSGSMPRISVPVSWDELNTPKGSADYWTWQRVLEDSESRQLAWKTFFNAR